MATETYRTSVEEDEVAGQAAHSEAEASAVEVAAEEDADSEAVEEASE